MSIPRRPLSQLRNQPNGLAGLDSSGRITSPVRGQVSLLDYGADPTGVVPCDAAMAQAIADNSIGTGRNLVGPKIHCPVGNFRFSGELNLKAPVHIIGSTSITHRTTFIFPENSRGIIVNRHNTFSDGVVASGTQADGTIIEGIRLLGSGTEINANGIWLRARAALRDVIVSGFGGNGIHIVAGAGFFETDPGIEGNANNWVIDSAVAGGNGGWGLFVDGPDVNAGNCYGLDASANGDGGIFDSSFLGNTYYGCHTATNGSQVSGKNSARNRTAMVFHNGARYYAAQNATSEQLVTTEPGTDENVWVFNTLWSAASITHPQWVSGQIAGRYFVSDQYRTDNLNARNVFIGCYQEGGYTESHFVLPTMIVGGSMGAVNGGVYLQPTLNGLRLNTPLNAETVVVRSGGQEGLVLSATGDHPSGLAGFAFDGSSGDWITRHARLGARTPVRYTTELSTFTGGRSSAVGPGHIRFQRGCFIGDRFVDSGTAAPTTGEWARGDRRLNSAPSAGGYVGWVCTTAGTPGTWKGYGAIEP